MFQLIIMIFCVLWVVDSVVLFLTYQCCWVGCLNMIVWTHAVFLCLICMCFTFLHLYLLSAVEHVSHGKVL